MGRHVFPYSTVRDVVDYLHISSVKNKSKEQNCALKQLVEESA